MLNDNSVTSQIAISRVTITTSIGIVLVQMITDTTDAPQLSVLDSSLSRPSEAPYANTASNSNPTLLDFLRCDSAWGAFHSNRNDRVVGDHVLQKRCLREFWFLPSLKYLLSFSSPFPSNLKFSAFQNTPKMTRLCTNYQNKIMNEQAWCAQSQYCKPEADSCTWPVANDEQFWENTTDHNTILPIWEQSQVSGVKIPSSQHALCCIPHSFRLMKIH